MHSLQYNRGMRILSERVYALTEKRGWTKGQLHVQTQLLRPGISRSTVYDAINDQRSPTLEVVSVIARALGTTIAYLVGEVDDPSSTLSNDDILPDVRDWSVRLKALPPDRQARAIRLISDIVTLAESDA